MWRVSSQRTVSAAASSSSTRSVTSARFPIGVAQTASGTPHRTPSSASNATSAAPIRPASSPSSASTIRSVSSAGWIASARAAIARRLEHEVAGGGAEAPTDDHDVRIEDVDERPDRGPEQPADLRQGLDRTRIAGPCARDENRGVGTRPVELGGRSIGREPRRDEPRDALARGSSPGRAAHRRRRPRARARPSPGRDGRR